MRVISKARLRTFWGRHADAKGSLQAWYTQVNHRTTSWNSWGDVRASYATASLVGRCVVFNIGGNKYRLITRVLFPSQKVLVLKVMTHREYDDGAWLEECGCYTPPPTKRQPVKGKPKGA